MSSPIDPTNPPWVNGASPPTWATHPQAPNGQPQAPNGQPQVGWGPQAAPSPTAPAQATQTAWNGSQGVPPQVGLSAWAAQPGNPWQPRRFDFRKGALWLSTAVAPVLDDVWLIRDWIPRRGSSVVFGASGAGKSHLVGNMACHVAKGLDWQGNPVEPGLVVYISLEGHGSLPNRVAALARTFGNAPVWFLRVPFSLAGVAGCIDELVATIHEEAAKVGLIVRWVILDTLARAMAGMEENGSKDMGIAVAGMEVISAALDCAVTAVHHSGKDQARGERGSNALRGAAEASIEVTAEGRGAAKVITAATAKVRDGNDDGTFTFRLKQVTLGIDKWNRPVTSCTVVPLSAEEAAARRVRAAAARLTAQQRDGLESLRVATERAGQQLVGSDIRVVTEDVWRDAFYLQMNGDSTPEAKRKAFHRVRKDLTEKGHVASNGENFWLPDGRDIAGHSGTMSRMSRVGVPGHSGTSTYRVQSHVPPARRDWEDLQ